MHFTDDVVAPLTAERGHNLRAPQGRTYSRVDDGAESSGTSEFRLVRDLPPNFLIASRSRRPREANLKRRRADAGLTMDGERFRFDERGATTRRLS